MKKVKASCQIWKMIDDRCTTAHVDSYITFAARLLPAVDDSSLFTGINSTSYLEQVVIFERWLMKDDWWQMHHDARWFIYYLCCEVASSCWWQLVLDCSSSRQPWSHHCIHQILNIFEFQSAFWHELIKNKNKNGIFEVVFVCQKWTSIFEFWRFSKMGRHFFRCFWFPIGTRNQEKKQKRHFCFCFWRPFWNDLTTP